MRQETSYIFLSLLLLVFLVLSPFVALLVSRYDLDWTTLNDVGGSYGLVSTVLNGIALIGVVITLALQRRQSSLATEHAARQIQVELMRDAWQDPVLLRALSVVLPGEEESARQQVFLNMIFMYLRMGYRSDQISLAEIEDLASLHFRTEAGARYWENAREHMRKHYEPGFVRSLENGFSRSRPGAPDRPSGSDQPASTVADPGPI